MIGLLLGQRVTLVITAEVTRHEIAFSGQTEIVRLDCESILSGAGADGELAQAKGLQAIAVQSDFVSMIPGPSGQGDGFDIEETQFSDLFVTSSTADDVGLFASDDGSDRLR